MLRLARALAVCATALWLPACSASSLTAPTSAPPPDTGRTPSSAVASTWTLSGTLRATNGGQPLAGMTVAAAGITTTTDGTGFYALAIPSGVGGTTVSLTVSGPGLLPRGLHIVNRGTSRAVDIDAIALVAPFSLDWFRQLARNVYDGRGTFVIRRWTTAPHVYIRTVDNAGRPVEPEVVHLVAEWARRSVPQWTSGALAVGLLESGAEARPDTAGWLMVDFVRDAQTLECGHSTIGSNPGRIRFNNDRCGCGSTKVAPGTVLHEFGHALGFGHVSDRGSIMYPQIPGGCAAPQLSPLEQYHAALAYRRPAGNADPDLDPVSAAY